MFATTRKPRGRRILIHAAPGSGGSLLAFILAQAKDTIAFPNLRVPPPSPEELRDVPPSSDVVLKIPMGSPNMTLERAVNRFQPDIKILLVRHPAAVASALHSLRGKGRVGGVGGGDDDDDKDDDGDVNYDNNGKKSSRKKITMAEMAAQAAPGEFQGRERVLRALEWTWSSAQRMKWDAVLLFEEVLFNPAVTRQKLKSAGFGDIALDQMDRMRRTKKDLERWNGKHCRWSRGQRHPSRTARARLIAAPGCEWLCCFLLSVIKKWWIA